MKALSFKAYGRKLSAAYRLSALRIAYAFITMPKCKDGRKERAQSMFGRDVGIKVKSTMTPRAALEKNGRDRLQPVLW